MQYNDSNNASRTTAVRQACEGHAIIFTIWFTRPIDPGVARQACVESGAQGFLAEAEIPSEWVNPATGQVEPKPEAQNWPALIHELSDLPIPKGVVTNFAPFVHANGLPYPEKARPLIDAGWFCLTECYLAENANSTPERTDFYAKANLGWSETQPVLGIYGGKTLDDYPTRNNYRNWSVWDAASVL